MQKILVALTFSLTTFTPALAEETVTIPLTEYRAILERIDAMQGKMGELDALRWRVEELEGERRTAPAATGAERAACNREIDTIYNTLDTLETRQAQNKVNLGAELRTRVDGYRVKSYANSDMNTFQELVFSGVPPIEARKRAMTYVDAMTDNNNWTNRFRINMDARLGDSLTFNGRLSMYKNWGDSDDASTGDMLNDWNSSHWPGTSNLWVDRAYVDWTPSGLPIPLALTIGRHPSSDGPPLEFKENRLRQSTYPGLIIDGEADGIVLTLGLDKFTGWNKTGLRFAYGKAYHSDDDSVAGAAFPFLDDDDDGDSDMFAAFFESELPGVQDSLMVFSYVRAWNLPSRFGDSASNSFVLPHQSVGEIDLWGAHFQVRDLLDSGLDLFASYGGNRSHPNGNAAAGLFGLLSDDGVESHDGYALYGGLRYTIPFEPLNQPKLGLEYNYGSKYWFSMTMGTSEIFNKLATRGSAWDLYYIQPINKYLFFRAGFMHVSYSHSRSGCYLTEPQPSEAKLDNSYLLMDVRF